MKTKITFLFIILILYISLLHHYFLVEEILIIYLLPVFASLAINGVSFLIRKSIGKKTSLLDDLKKELKWYAIVQLLMLASIVFLAYPRHFDRKMIEKDLDYMVGKLEDVHPDLYHSISREEFHNHLNDMKNGLPEKVSEQKLYKELSRLLALFQDGHTRPGESFYQRRLKILFLRLFPYRIRIEGENIYVIGNYSFKNKIPAGGKILEINGIHAGELIVQLKRLLSFDNRHNFRAQLENPVLIGLWNDFENYDIVYKSPQNGEVRKIESRGGLFSNLAILKRLLKGQREPFYEFKIIDGDVGYLGFYGFRKLEKFKSFLKATFTEIRDQKIKNLIIDIRDNGGGSSYLGNELMQYISPQPFTMLDSMQIKLSKEIIAQNYVSWIDSSRRIPGTMYNYSRNSKIALRKNPLRFQGDCYLLINEKVYSSAVIFASAFKCNNVGKIIGSETGGVTVAYGDVFDFRLPGAGFQINVSWKRFYHACGIDNGTGVIPDYRIENSIEDEINGNDTVLEYTLNLIK